MAVRSRRTKFAASVVAVAAGAGCPHGGTSPITEWSVTRSSDGACQALRKADCDRCNPPGPQRVACPMAMPPDGVKIVSFDGTHCLLASDQTPIACPGSEPPPPPPADAAPAAFEPRRWLITQGDHACFAALVSFHCPAGTTCNPPAPRGVTCPPYSAGSHVDETAPDSCRMLVIGSGGNCPPGLRCNPPPPREVDVACPP